MNLSRFPQTADFAFATGEGSFATFGCVWPIGRTGLRPVFVKSTFCPAIQRCSTA